MRRHVLAVPATLLIAAVAAAQPSYPNPRLTVLTPCGAKAGSTVEVTVTGDHLEEIDRLLFSLPGFAAKKLPPPEPDPKQQNPPPPPIRFEIKVPADAPVGIHEVRAVGKYGVSNSRAFVVGTLEEVAEAEPNSDLPEANPIPLNSTVSGDITNQTDVDFFKVACGNGQRVIVHCQAAEIDSRLVPEVRIFAPDGRPLAQSRLYSDGDAVADFLAEGDGEYIVRLAHVAYQYGGNEYFYRLSVHTGPWIDAAFPPVVEPGKNSKVTLVGRNLPNGQPAEGMATDGRPLQRLEVNVKSPGGPGSLEFVNPPQPRSAFLDGFEYRTGSPLSNPVLLAYATSPVVLQNGTNTSPEQAQEISIPCEVCGRMSDPRQRDWYRFTARKGEEIYFEGFADRLGSPMDLYFEIRRKDNKQVLGYYDNHPSIPVRAGTFFTYTDDPAVRFTAPEDGEYELMLASRSSDPSAGPRSVYRLVARQPRPDFALVLVGNGDPSSAGNTLRQGASTNLQVVCYRLDGFEGEVALKVEGLPGGVTCSPQVIGPGQSDTQLVLTAAENAPDSLAQLKIKGTATVEGKNITREARYGAQVWPTQVQGTVPAVSRMSRSLWLAVREKGAFALQTSTPEVMAAVGQNGVEVKYKLVGYHPEFKAAVQLRGLSTPIRTNGQIVTLPNTNVNVGQEQGMKFNVPGDARPGTYNVVMAASAQFQFQKSAEGKKENVQVFQVTPPVKLTVYDRVAELTLPKPKPSVEAGQEVELVVKLNRLFDYQGEFDLQVQLPGGVGGLSIAQVKVPANAGEAKVVIKTAPNTQPLDREDFKLRATARVENATLTHEVPFGLVVTPPPPKE